jgi:trk system potassium uptake protein TrkH
MSSPLAPTPARTRSFTPRALRERLARAAALPRTPEGLLATSFGALIVVGTLLLWLPWAHHGAVGPLEALFTATSAVCVTGLIVVDTGSQFTGFGQGVILTLIQVGGLGVMTLGAVAFRLFGRRLSLRGEAAVSDSLLQRDVASEFRELFPRIVRMVLGIELLGALVLFVAVLPGRPVGAALWWGLFHAVSAFCNAGFGLHADSLTGLRSDAVVVPTVLLLIVLGGIGHPVLVDLRAALAARLRRRDAAPHRLALHTKVVLAASAVLVPVGALLLALYGLTPDVDGAGGIAANAVFQSVSARTAGFNTVPLDGMPTASLLVLILLMFVGGSPGSCAGGVKTSTAALWLAKLWALLRGSKAPCLFERHIPGELTRRASLIIGLSVLWNVLGLFVLLATEGSPAGGRLVDLLFEQFSAFGTVGLSTGVTSGLSVAGKLWICATMFVGRVGPLTLAAWAIQRRPPGVRYPDGKVLIG